MRHFKNYILKILYNFLNKRNFWLSNKISTPLIINFLTELIANSRKQDLIFVGPHSDGGYYVPNILDNIDFCFSPGVGDQTLFEINLIKFNIVCYLADGTIEFDNPDPLMIKFINKNIGILNNDYEMQLANWVNYYKNQLIGKKGILQMDIEGFEYFAILDTDIDFLSNYFDILIIEFHNFIKYLNNEHLQFLEIVFAKIFKNYYIVNFSDNNFGEYKYFNDFIVPDLIEITFVKKELSTNNKYKGSPDKKINNPNGFKVNKEDLFWNKIS